MVSVRLKSALSRNEKTDRDDRDFSETLFWGSLKIVGVVNRLVSNYSDKMLEKRGFSLFRHEYLPVIRCEDEDDYRRRDVTQSHVLAHCHSSQTRFSISWRSVSLFLRLVSWSDAYLAVCSQGLAITPVCRTVASETHARL